MTLALAALPFSAHAQDLTALGQLKTAGTSGVMEAPLPQVPLNVTGTEATGIYNDFFANADARFDAAAAAKLKDCKVLLIPGFLSDVDPGQFHLPLAPSAKGYFEDQMNWLKAMGVEYERLQMKSESSVQVNGAIISAAIKASSKPVIIIAHSKGGLDTLEALRAAGEVRAKVRGVITLQSPYFGSPVADYVNSNNYLSEYAVKLLLKMGGNKESMLNLTVADRKKYMADNSASIAEITAAVPVIAVATFKDPVDGKLDTDLKLFRDAMFEKGIHNDGLVPVDSAILPGAGIVRLEGLDHSVTIRSAKTIAFDRVKLSKALLLTLFAR